MSVFRKRSVSNVLLEAQQGEVLKVGFLRKKGHVRRNWLDRWFVLTTQGLYYYKNKDDPKPAGVIPLIRAEVQEDTSGRHLHVFTCVTIEGKDYPIQASTRDEMLVWIKVIGEAIHNATVKGNNVQEPRTEDPPVTEARSISNGSQQKGASKKSADYDSYEEDDDDD